jgi:hypothetical protein
MGVRPSPNGRRWLLLSVVAALAVSVGVAFARFLPESGTTSPGEGWVRVGSIEEVRTEGVLSLPELRA